MKYRAKCDFWTKLLTKANDYRWEVYWHSITWWSYNNPDQLKRGSMDALLNDSLTELDNIGPTTERLYSAKEVADFIAYAQSQRAVPTGAVPETVPPPALNDAHAQEMKQKLTELIGLFGSD